MTNNVKEIIIITVVATIIVVLVSGSMFISKLANDENLKCAQSSCPEGWYPWMDGGKCSCKPKAPPIPVPAGEAIK